MAISLGSNLALHTRLPLDDRTIMETIEEMKDYPENFLPDIAYCFVKADGKMYVFNRENESIELTGKWRVLEGSGGGTAEVPIEKIKVNGELQTPVNKVVDITIPDAYDDTSLSNRVKAVEDEVPNLATKTYVGEQIANAEHLKREIVTVLPSDEEASDNILYMLKVESATGNDKYQEYMKINGTVQMVGDTSVDLTDYAKSADIPTTVAELTDSADYAKKTDLHSHDNKTVLDGITSTKISNWDAAKTHADSAHAPSNAQANVIETVKVNGTALEVSNKAVNVTVPTKVSELTDSADYAKTADIPTTLPANGGNSDTVNNHTVKSDVPENAVFTDTIYDDTEVKESIEELSSNLDTLEFGEVAGGKNLLDIEEKIYSNSVTDEKTSFIATLKVNNTWAGAVNVTGNGIFSITFDITDSNINNIKLYHSGSHVDITLIYKDIYLDVGKYTMSFDAIGCNPQVVNGIKIQKIQIEKGTTATEYEPYIPSVKMLAEENAQQNTEAIDLKMLGWNVPKECPVQNYVDSDEVFHQRVGRVDLGSLDYTYVSGTNSRFASSSLLPVAKDIDNDNDVIANAYCTKYIMDTRNNIYNHVKDKTIIVSNKFIWIYDTEYTDATTFKTAMQGIYLYYELAEEITKPVDGNEAISKVNDSLSVIGKCKNLLNSTLQTTTLNGVTCTNNGDGTYTLNGTASSDVVLALESYKSYTGKEKFRLVGCPNGGGKDKYYLAFRPYNAEENRKDIGSGVTFNDLSTSNKYAVAIIVLNGTTVTNLTFKPMLTENLNATYDDFVPYTGDGETLTHDVANLRGSLNELSTYSTEETKVGTWIDGKPIYQKTVFSSFTNYTVGEYTTFAIPFGNINVISIDGMINYDSTFPVPVNYHYEKSSDNNIQRMSTFYSKNSGSIVTFVYSSKTTDYNNANYFVTVRYTKTTD